MKARFTLLSLILLAPSLAFAATFAEKRTLVLSEPPPDNVYLAGTNVTVRTPLPADLSVAGVNVNVLAPVTGDVLAGGGTIDLEEPVAGDVRMAGARIIVNGPVGGDVVAAGGSIQVAGKSRDMRLFGGTVDVSGGSSGPVTIYGADITLSGQYDGDVEIIASDRFTIAEGTHIHGVLRYNAPQQADVPASAVIDGGTTYTGSYSYVPTNAEAKRFALLGSGIFFIVRALALMIAAGLLAGLFPAFARIFSARTVAASGRRMSLLALLGFGLIVATPFLILALVLSFVGGAIAIVLGLAYLLSLFLSYLYAGILVGGAIRERVMRGRAPGIITWKDALLGMLVFFLLGSIPFVGWAISLVLVCLAFGALASAFYAFSFAKSADDPDEF